MNTFKELIKELENIAGKAEKSYITVYECNKLMINEIDNFDFYGNDELKWYENKLKAYHKMYKILFELTKSC